MFNLITPSEYIKKYPEQLKYHSLEALKKRSKSNKKCEVCGQPAWKLAGTGLCFSCTTGESDNSSDYELIEEN